MSDASVDFSGQGSVYGLMAEFDSPQELLTAAEKTHGAGYKQIDAFSPFPVEGLADEATVHGAAAQGHGGLRIVVVNGAVASRARLAAGREERRRQAEDGEDGQCQQDVSGNHGTVVTNHHERSTSVNEEKQVPEDATPTNRWTAAAVRKVFVS